MTSLSSNSDEYRGRRVTIMGLGLFGGGAAAARYFAQRGAIVTVTDLKPAERLSRSLENLKSAGNIRLVLGEHRQEDFTGAQLVIVNPAVPKDSPFLKTAAEAGVALDTETNIFFRKCPAPIIGITGSNGKTTTTALTAEMLEGGPRRVWLGGNIGRPLIEYVDDISPEDIVVLELSSFQLEDLHSIRRSPAVAVVTNLSPNHLDRHGTMENYAAAKKAIIKYQNPGDTAILNADDATVRDWSDGCASKSAFFSLVSEVETGAFLSNGRLYLKDKGGSHFVCGREKIRLPGDFNVANVLAASVAAATLGAGPEQIARAAGDFRGVEHRLEMFLEKDGVSYFNDSIATTPESAIAALGAVPKPIVLIAGGYDKKIPPDSFGYAIAAHCESVVLVGQIAQTLRESIEKHRSGEKPHIIMAGTSFRDAVKQALKMRRPGGCVLLSPGTASYDMFENFEKRGGAFKELVRNLPG